MDITWTPIQKQRLKELNISSILQERRFESASERDLAFQDLERQLVTKGRRHLAQFQKFIKRPLLSRLEQQLTEALNLRGFVQVMTPTIIAKGSLAKMSIDDKHPLFSQVFWLDAKRCLRPMLAPNLYTLWKALLRFWQPPIRLFEIGTCYR